MDLLEDDTPGSAKSLKNTSKEILSDFRHWGVRHCDSPRHAGTGIHAPRPMKRHAITFALARSANTQLIFGADHAAAPVRTDSAWPAKARAGYPLRTCVVTGEDLVGDGDMAEAKDLNHEQPGRPDRLIRLCWGKCRTQFERDPTRYLTIVDKATARATNHG